MSGSVPLAGVVFDAYGTLLDVHAAMARHAVRLPPDWERISAEWRAKQLEYTWVRTLTGPAHHADFWTVTRDALAFVAARNRMTDTSVLDALLDTYRRLPAFRDAAPTLRALKAAGLRTAILSNGEPGMLADAVGAAGLADLLDAVVSVEPAGAFKPHPSVYGLVTEALELPPERLGFVSGNAWDAQAAAALGFRVFWCNRADAPAEYGLDRTATVLTGLADLPDHVA